MDDGGYTISGDADNYYVTDPNGRIMSTHDTADEARDALDRLLRQDHNGGLIPREEIAGAEGVGRE